MENLLEEVLLRVLTVKEKHKFRGTSLFCKVGQVEQCALRKEYRLSVSNLNEELAGVHVQDTRIRAQSLHSCEATTGINCESLVFTIGELKDVQQGLAKDILESDWNFFWHSFQEVILTTLFGERLL